MSEISETLGDVSKYGFYVWNSQAMLSKSQTRKNTDYTWQKSSQKDLSKEGDKREGDMEIVEVAMTDKADAISVENGIAVNVRVFNVRD